MEPRDDRPGRGRPLEGAIAGRPAGRTTWEAIASAAPDLMILAPWSFSVERSFTELAHAPLRQLPDRFPRSEIWVADEAYFSRPGPAPVRRDWSSSPT